MKKDCICFGWLSIKVSSKILCVRETERQRESVCEAEGLICPRQRSGTEALTDVWKLREAGGLHSQPCVLGLHMSGSRETAIKTFHTDCNKQTCEMLLPSGCMRVCVFSSAVLLALIVFLYSTSHGHAL